MLSTAINPCGNPRPREQCTGKLPCVMELTHFERSNQNRESAMSGQRKGAGTAVLRRDAGRTECTDTLDRFLQHLWGSCLLLQVKRSY